jgi:hypothetical protein
MSQNISPLESVDDTQEESIRCTYINVRGHRCTTPLPDDTSDFCVNHARLLDRRELADAKKLADELLGPDPYGSRNDFADLFLRLFQAIASKRLSRRDGAVLAYTASRALQCYPPLRPENNSDSKDGLPLNYYGLPIPPPKKYERDEATGIWREVTAEEKSAQQASPTAEQTQSPSERGSEPDANEDANETRPEPAEPAPAPQPYQAPPNPHENPFGPYLTDPRPRHLRNLYPYRHRL